MPEQEGLTWGVSSLATLKDILFYTVIIALLLTGITMRMTSPSAPWFLEPDGFYHYSIALQTMQNESVPQVSALDNQPVTESFGLYTMPVFIAETFNIPLLSAMRILPIIFFIITFIALALVVKELTRNRYILLMSLFILLFSTASISRSSEAIYRGDCFLPALLMLSFLFLVKAIKNNSMSHAIFSGILLVPAEFVWNESGFIAPLLTRMVVFVALSLYIVAFQGATTNRLKTLKLIPTSIVAYLFTLTPVILALSINQSLIASTGKFAYTILLSLAMTLGMAIIIAFINRFGERLGRKKLLSVLLGAYIIISLAFITLIALPIRTSGDSMQAIQETQAPNPVYLLSLFSTQLFMTPMMLLFFIMSAFTTNPFLVWIVASAPIILYFFMPNLDLIEGESTRLAFVALMAFFSTMLFLTASQIRFSAMLAIPLAFVSALTLWEIGKIRYVGLPIVILLLLFLLLFTIQSLVITQPADNLNPQFFSALDWMKGNTPTNSTVLTLWTDGSVVEGYAQRFSEFDSVAALGNGIISPFNRILLTRELAKATLFTFNGIKPDYLLVRQYWIWEAYGMAQEAKLNATQFFINNETQLRQALEGTVMGQLLGGCRQCQGLTEVFQNNDSIVYKVT